MLKNRYNKSTKVFQVSKQLEIQQQFFLKQVNLATTSQQPIKIQLVQQN